MDEMMRQIRQNSRRLDSPWYNVDTVLVEQRPVTIRGRETTMSISEGKDGRGELYRMASATFDGKAGSPAVLMILVPADQWDEKMVDDLIISIQ